MRHPIAGHIVLARRMVQSIRRAAGVFTKILHRALPPHSTRGCVARHFMEYGWRDEHSRHGVRSRSLSSILHDPFSARPMFMQSTELIHGTPTATRPGRHLDRRTRESLHSLAHMSIAIHGIDSGQIVQDGSFHNDHRPDRPTASSQTHRSRR